MFTRDLIRNCHLGIALCIFAGMSGCGGGGGVPPTPASVLRAVPLQLVTNSQTLQGKLVIWRNLMPGIGTSNDKGIIAVFTISRQNDTSPPTDIRIQKVSLVSDNEVWETTKIQFADSASVYHGTVSNGPFWNAGKTVDAVVEFQDSTGTVQQLRATSTIFNAY
jgi:hypothetical protein